MKESLLKVVVKKPNQLPQVTEIKDDLDEYHKILEGYMEVVPLLLDDNRILVLCNEDGKSQNLKPNLKYYNDILVGNLIFIGNDAPEFRSLTQDEIDVIRGFSLFNSLATH